MNQFLKRGQHKWSNVMLNRYTVLWRKLLKCYVRKFNHGEEMNKRNKKPLINGRCRMVWFTPIIQLRAWDQSHILTAVIMNSDGCRVHAGNAHGCEGPVCVWGGGAGRGGWIKDESLSQPKDGYSCSSSLIVLFKSWDLLLPTFLLVRNSHCKGWPTDTICVHILMYKSK